MCIETASGCFFNSVDSTKLCLVIWFDYRRYMSTVVTVLLKDCITQEFFKLDFFWVLYHIGDSFVCAYRMPKIRYRSILICKKRKSEIFNHASIIISFDDEWGKWTGSCQCFIFCHLQTNKYPTGLRLGFVNKKITKMWRGIKKRIWESTFIQCFRIMNGGYKVGYFLLVQSTGEPKSHVTKNLFKKMQEMLCHNIVYLWNSRGY